LRRRSATRPSARGSVDGAALLTIRERRRACPGGDLTRREREVLALLADGLTDRQIARSLGLSEGTVRLHVGGVLRKLGAPNRTAAAVLAVEQSLI
jgi:DNA-binding NarL/FixJ family response regulator